MPSPISHDVVSACQQVVSLHLTAIEFYTLAAAQTLARLNPDLTFCYVSGRSG